MGTIAEKSDYLIETKELIKESINNLGGSITSETTFREYAEELDTIYSNLPKVTGENTEVTLTPTLKGKLGIVEKGNSTQESTTGKQLWKPYNFTKTNVNGINWEVKTNGTINASGTATGTSTTAYSSEISTEFYTLSAGSYIVSGATSKILLEVINSSGTRIALTTSSETSKTFTLNADTSIQVRGYIASGTALTGTETIKPMINTGSTALNWEQYTGGIPAPNPSYPFPIKSVTGNNNVVVNNKNLVDTTYFSGKGINASGVLTGNSTLDTHIAPVIAGQTYTVTTDDSNLVLGYYYEKPTENSVTYDNTRHVSSNKTFTSVITGWVSFRTLANYPTPQLEVGSTATSYVEHAEQTLPLNLGNIELNKIGNYQDYIYKNNDRWYKKEYIGTLNVQDFKDSPSWQIANSGTASWYYSLVNTGYIPIANAFSTDYGLCNHYQLTAVGNSGANEGISLLISGTMRIRYGTQDTTSNFKTWLASNEVILKYAKATATDIEITDTTLISQLENIDKMKSYNGTTIITSTYDNSNAQMILSASGLKGE